MFFTEFDDEHFVISRLSFKTINNRLMAKLCQSNENLATGNDKPVQIDLFRVVFTNKSETFC